MLNSPIMIDLCSPYDFMLSCYLYRITLFPLHTVFMFPALSWFALKRLGIWSCAVLVYFPRSKTKDVVMFYSLETNQIKKMKSRSR